MSTSLVTEAGLRAKLAELVCTDSGSSSHDHEIEQEQAEALFARIVWSRLAEPGDGTAGALLQNLGPERALKLLVRRASPNEVCTDLRSAGIELSVRAVDSALKRWIPRLDRRATLTDIDQALAHRLRALTPGSSAWPSSVDDLDLHAPTMLWIRGNPQLLQTTSLSVVGARAATGYGTHATAEIVDGCCRFGVTIVSGAAYGIDAVAHRTALAAEGLTVAVLAGGADRPYPAAHDTLLERIGREGVVCAEMVPGSAPTKWRFRMRNRIIAALSQATLVTEAGVRSGTINTAGHAAELGRVLGAMPGPVTSAASAGCHRLIREYGAVLVTNATEACELLGIDSRLLGIGEETDQGAERLPSEHERILDAFPLRGARDATDIAKQAGLGVATVQGSLAELELLGLVNRSETFGTGEAMWVRARK